MVKIPPANANEGDARDAGLVPGSGGSLERGNGNPLRILAWKSHGQRSLAGYNLWGLKDLGELKSLLKTEHSKNEDHGTQSNDFTANRWDHNGNSDRFYFLGLQNHC